MQPVNRRQFVVAATAALGFIPLLSACGGGGSAPETASACPGYDTLTPEQLQARQALNYVDKTPQPEKHCGNCRFFNKDASSETCGGCQLFQGPVVAQGYCTAWAAIA